LGSALAACSDNVSTTQQNGPRVPAAAPSYTPPGLVEITADLEREASASSRIAVPAPAPGRVTEQGIDAGGGAGPARRLVPRKTGTSGVLGSGARNGKLSGIGAAGRVMAWRTEDVD